MTFLHQPQTVSVNELDGSGISIKVKSASSEVVIFLDDIDELVKFTKALKSGTYNKVHWLK